MTKAMGDYTYALKFRDVIIEIIKEQIEAIRPRYQMATVISIDRINYTCMVRFPGDTTDAKVNMGSTQPAAVGQIVRVEGLNGDRYIADVMGPPYDPTSTEIVTQITPTFKSRLADDVSATPVAFFATDAVNGVEVGDRVEILNKPDGERIAINLFEVKSLVEKFSGETIGQVGGKSFNANANVNLRARVNGGSYATFSNGDVTIPIPDPPGLNWSYTNQSSSIPVTLGDAGSVTLAAFNEDRRRINSIISVLSYINGRLVNLDTNN